ncbi:hypothetical protein HBB16_14140 [Pseudonocardia sp. MCCB 268]|nr:hypothetical protein [Pseudonocardia cytotoxica]
MIVTTGLSGVRAGGVPGQAGAGTSAPAVEVATVLRFGVGAWPAIAAAVVAHLLYLLAADDHARRTGTPLHGRRAGLGGPGAGRGGGERRAVVSRWCRARWSWDTGLAWASCPGHAGCPSAVPSVSAGPSQRRAVPAGAGRRQGGEGQAVAPSGPRPRHRARPPAAPPGPTHRAQRLQDLASAGEPQHGLSSGSANSPAGRPACTSSPQSRPPDPDTDHQWQRPPPTSTTRTATEHITSSEATTPNRPKSTPRSKASHRCITIQGRADSTGCTELPTLLISAAAVFMIVSGWSAC